MKESFGLLGVLLGFVLSQFATTLQDYWKAKKSKRLIREEIEANLALLPHKMDLVEQIIHELASKKVIPGDTVHFMSNSYELNLHLAYESLSPVQRDVLHVIYERLKLADVFLANFDSEIQKHLTSKLVKDPYAMFTIRMNEIKESFQINEDLMKSYLSDKPIDVFKRLSTQNVV
jgi:hypothetical protein